MESATDGGDVPNTNEIDEDLKETADFKKDKQPEDVKEMVNLSSTEENAQPVLKSVDIDFSGNHENNDAVEDCLNLNLEDEENFEEVRW